MLVAVEFRRMASAGPLFASAILGPGQKSTSRHKDAYFLSKPSSCETSRSGPFGNSHKITANGCLQSNRPVSPAYL
jgi:hypothetical protein